MKEYKPLSWPWTAVLLKSAIQFANGCQLFLPGASECATIRASLKQLKN
jgi:hypothetical protein